MLNKEKYCKAVKKYLLCFIMLISISTFAQTKNTNKVFNPKGTEILLYTEPNFKGKQLVINTTGEFDLAVARPMWNNVISSIQVPDGYTVTLYDTRQVDGGELPTYVELGTSKNNKSFTIKDFKTLPTLNYVTPSSGDYSDDKIKIINFDNKTSYIEIAKY